MIDLRRYSERWHRLDVTLRDLPLGLVILAGSLIPAFHGNGTQLGELPVRPFDWLGLLSVVFECLPLAVRRRWPVVCMALVALGFAIDQLRAYHLFAGTALPIAVLSVAAHQGRYRRTVAALLTAAFAALAIGLVGIGGKETVAGFLVFYLALVFAWGIGAWLRSTRATEAELRIRIAEDTRSAERARIARELHDVVTHHVTAMVVQTEAARYLTTVPDRLDQTLTNVTDTGRRAITDLRHLLDVLEPGSDGDSRAPSAGELRAVVEQTRRAGQPVEFIEDGTPAASAGSADMIAHRVVREALTNALKYAHGSRTLVQVWHSHKEITVSVSTDGSGSAAGSPGGAGRGLAGLRERVGVLGGDFSAGRRPDGGFDVRARIPAGKPT